VFPHCSTATFFGQVSGLITGESEICGSDTQIGWVSPGLSSEGFLVFPPGLFKEPLYNLEAPGGDSHVVARFGFVAIFFPMVIDVRLDPKRGDGLTATIVSAPEIDLARVFATYTRFWGVPTDEVHDSERFSFREAVGCGGPCAGPVRSGLPPTPLMSNPTSCGPKSVGTSTVSYERWPEGVAFDSTPLGDITGCPAVPFEPSMSVAPTSGNAGVASGLDVELQIPQPGLSNPRGKASAHLRKSVVTLPEGVTLNASAADGLESCSEEQVGLDTDERQTVNYRNHGAPLSLSFGGQSTATLPEYATAAQVQAALESLPAIGPGNVAVRGREGGPWTVDFQGALAGKDVPTITGVNSDAQRLSISATEGTYRLKLEGEETDPIPYTAQAPDVQAQLEALSAIGPGQVSVTGGATSSFATGRREFRIIFGGGLTGADVPTITVDTSGLGLSDYAQVSILADGGSAISTEVVEEGGSLRFDDADPTCPQASKVASGEIVTPVLNEPLHASYYLAKQQDNPFDSLFAGYLVAKGGGATLKVASKIEIDPDTGQIVTTFEENPEQPFSELSLRFKSGNRGLITTPDACGDYVSTYELTPWTGQPPVVGTSKFTVDGNCQHQFDPDFSAGSESPLAGGFTNFFTRVVRQSGSPVLSRLSVALPPGLTAKLAGVPYCPDSSLAAISTALGGGGSEIAASMCPEASRVGTITAGTGSGAPFYVNGGRLYLAGPYEGAPLSLAAVVPTVAGPFDLGNVTVRVPVRLDPVTARVSAVTDPLPTMVHGLPIDLRDLRVNLDRAGFALNPTNCAPKQVEAKIDAVGGLSADRSERFQIGECAALGFRPKASLRLRGGTTRTKHPALTAIIRPRLGDANLAGVSVTLPSSELLDQSHIGTVCTKLQWAADQCPPASVYGTVTATTPLLDSPLTGNVYLRSSSHQLPDLVTDLRGPPSQPIRLEAAGSTDTVNDRLRNSFEFIPDAPISRVVLKLKGGKKGLLQNNTNICAKDYRASVRFTAHNGRSYGVNPKVVTSCSGNARRHRHNAR
jgi:hypothetical protein